jgi:hypothetical protein
VSDPAACTCRPGDQCRTCTRPDPKPEPSAVTQLTREMSTTRIAAEALVDNQESILAVAYTDPSGTRRVSYGSGGWLNVAVYGRDTTHPDSHAWRDS